MTSVLTSERVRSKLAELRAIGEREDARYHERLRAREAALGTRVLGPERAALGSLAPLAVSPEVGQALHALVLATRPTLVIEFGSSLGISTLYLAAALAELGSGSLITTELIPDKARHAQAALEAAGLSERVEVRTGDALSTLADLDRDVDLLFLDGANDLYISVLDLLRPRLTPRAVIAADMSVGDPHHREYRAHVNHPGRALISMEMDLDAGLIVSTPRPPGHAHVTE